MTATLAFDSTPRVQVAALWVNIVSLDAHVVSLASDRVHLDHHGSRLVGHAYLYKPTVTEANYKNKFMGKVVREYFDNSYKDLVNFFVEQKKLSAKELKEIIRAIEKGDH